MSTAKKAKQAKPVMHPATRKRQEEAMERLALLREDHRVAVAFMWAGILASNFTDEEMALLRSAGFLSPADEGFFAAARRGSPSWIMRRIGSW